MSVFSAVLRHPVTAGRVPNLPSLYPTAYSRMAQGGDDEATISARGSLEEMSTLLTTLRYGVEIVRPFGDKTWRGFVWSVELRYGSRTVNVSLGNMFNTIAVLFTDGQSSSWGGGQSWITWWAQDAPSKNWFGIRELLYPGGEMSKGQAEALRDTLLKAYKFPMLSPQTGQSEGGSFSAYVKCKGWFHTLGWEHFSDVAGEEGFTDESDGVQHVGEQTSNTAVVESFQVSSAAGWYADRIQIKVRKFGAPTDNLVLSLCDASKAVLQSVSIAGTSLTESYQWVTGEITKQWLATGTTYHVKVSRSGANDGTNFYSVDVSESLAYAGGTFSIWNGSIWVARDPDADMPFKVLGVRETTVQLVDIINSKAQFFTNIIIETASGVFSSPYRDGRNTSLFYVRELLDAGASDGRRYLCRVDEQMRLIVYKEPTATDLVVDSKENWYHVPGNMKLNKSDCPVGLWYRMQDSITPPGFAYLNDPGRYFIERCQYEIDKDNLVTEPYQASDTYDTMEIE